MNAGNFDTLAAVRELEEAGINPKHAEAIVAVHRHADEQLATKADVSLVRADVSLVRADLGAAVADLRAEFRTDLAALESRMLKVAYGLAFGVVLTNVSLTVALVKLL